MAWLFFRKDSQKAADALLDELRAKGRLSEKQMSRFVSKLEAGDLGLGALASACATEVKEMVPAPS